MKARAFIFRFARYDYFSMMARLLCAFYETSTVEARYFLNFPCMCFDI